MWIKFDLYRGGPDTLSIWAYVIRPFPDNDETPKLALFQEVDFTAKLEMNLKYEKNNNSPCYTTRGLIC